MTDSFAGNAEIKATIKNAVKSGRFPHAFIIEGEVGSGRHTLAKIIASAAICSSNDAPCGKCRECELIEKQGHCDVLTYTPDGATFKVDTVREIRENAYIMPIEAKRKVNILSDCEKMSDQAQNAFLKVLEEPPPFMVFILICQNAAALLSTVRSRCVTLSVKNPELSEALNYIQLKTGKSEQDIREALDLSHGNIGAALKILDGQESESVENARSFFESLVKTDRLSALKVLYKYEKDRLGLNVFLSELRMLLENELKLCALKKGNAITPNIAVRALSVITEAEKQINSHIGKPLSLQILTTDICAKIFE